MQQILDRIYNILSPYLPKAAKQFFTVSFITFLAVGAANTLSTTVISAVIDLCVQKTKVMHSDIFTKLHITFIVGYLLSMLLSFFLNCRFTFHEKPTLGKLIRFPISYIPNFIIQYAAVHFLTAKLYCPPTLSYLIAAVAAIPITFAVMRIFVFKK